MAGKVKCEETKQEKTKCMTDRDFLNDILASEKDITTNTATSITEASNRNLATMFLDFFDIVEELQREAYEMAWSNGWYTLEEAEAKKIKEEVKNLTKRIDELSN